MRGSWRPETAEAVRLLPLGLVVRGTGWIELKAVSKALLDNSLRTESGLIDHGLSFYWGMNPTIRLGAKRVRGFRVVRGALSTPPYCRSACGAPTGLAVRNQQTPFFRPRVKVSPISPDHTVDAAGRL